MIHTVFSIYDTKAKAYLPPFILPRKEMAQRTFADCVNAPDHQFHLHPEDYTLFDLGSFDDETARYLPNGNGPQSLGNGVQYLRQDDLTATEGPANGKDESIPPLSNEPPIQSSSSSSDTEE